jgi:hypothetical protein
MYQHQDIVAKGNSHSMFIWTKNSFQDSVVMWVYDLRGYEAGQKREPRSIKIDNLGKNISNQVLISLANVWECRPDCFLLACNSNLEKRDARRGNVVNFVFDSKTGTFNQCKFDFNGLDNERLIDRMSFGEYSIHPTFEYKAGVSIPSRVYVVSNEE